MTPELETELMKRRFPEFGVPYRVFRDPAGGRIAVCCSFSYLQWPGRTCYENQAFLHRVSLYDASLRNRIAVLNLAGRSKINDISFHPDEPQLLIGKGDYDGGYFFEGELLLWDWESGTCASLLGESREVVRCRFDHGGGVSFVLRPRHEEEFWNPDDTTGGGTMGAPDIYLVAKIDHPEPVPKSWPDPRLEHLQPGDPESEGFTIIREPWPVVLSQEETGFLKANGFQERGCIRDLLWLDDETFAVVHDRCHLEIGNTRGDCLSSFSGKGHGVELIATPGVGILVHVFERGDFHKKIDDRSSLLSYSNGQLEPFASFDHACSFSSDATGNLLARDVRYYLRCGRTRNDAILSPDGRIVFQADLGHVDLLSTHAERLYFLRGTPPDSHKHKVLCSIDPAGEVEELFPWDDPDRHAMSSLVVMVPGGLVRAYESYPGRVARIERISFADGATLWSTSLEKASFTSFVALPDHGCAAFAQANGNFGLIDLTSGDILHLAAAAVDGIPTIITALAVRGDRFLAGTIDGRVLLFRICIISEFRGPGIF